MNSLQKRFNDVLTEICKVSAMKATTSLSKFLNTPCGVNFKPVEIVSSQAMHLASMTYPQTVSLSSFIKSNVLQGYAFLLLSQTSSLAICDYLFHKSQGDTKKLNELEQSALIELANIVVGNYLMTFVQSLLTGSLLHLPASYQLESADKIQKSIREIVANQFDNKNTIKITFGYQSSHFSGSAVFIFDEERMNNILHQFLLIMNQ